MPLDMTQTWHIQTIQQHGSHPYPKEKVDDGFWSDTQRDKRQVKRLHKRDKQEKNIELLAGLTKSALQSSGIRGFSFRESNFSFSLVQWARDQATRPPTKSLKGQTKTCPGQKKFEGFLSWGKLEFKFFLPYISKHIWTFPSACLIPVSIYLATVPATYKI